LFRRVRELIMTAYPEAMALSHQMPTYRVGRRPHLGVWRHGQSL
jgi:hypothetical protein